MYFLGFEHQVTAVDDSAGTVRWSVTLPVDRPRTVGDGGAVFDSIVIVGDQDLFGLHARDGAVLWRFAPPEARDIGRLAPVVWQGQVLAGSSNGYLYAIDGVTGVQKWLQRLGTSPRYLVYTSPVVDSVLYVTTVDFFGSPNGEPVGALAALSASTGEILWSRRIPHYVDSLSPTATIMPVVAGGTVVAGSRDGPMYGFEAATGNLRWTVPPVSMGAATQPSHIRDIHWLATCGGVVFVGTTSSIVLALNPVSGAVLWQTEKTPWGSASWVWCDASNVYVVRPSGPLDVLDSRSGHARWGLHTGYDFFHGVLSSNGKLFVGGRSGLYCLTNDPG